MFKMLYWVNKKINMLTIFSVFFVIFCMFDSAIAIIVNPGESIQAAIDSLPAEGGIVELAEGTHNITSPIWINKSDVIVMGQGIDRTIINQTSSSTDAIIVSKFYDYVSRFNWLFLNSIKGDVLVQWFIDHPDEVVNNVTIRNLKISIHGSGTPKFAGIGSVEVTNITISNVEIVGDSDETLSYNLRGTVITHFIDGLVNDSVFNNVGAPILFQSGYRGNTVNNTITYGIDFASIHYNTVSGYEGTKCLIKGNCVTGTYGTTGIVYFYSGSGVTIEDNVIDVNLSNDYTGALKISLPLGEAIDIINNSIRLKTLGTHSGDIYIHTQYNYIANGNIMGNQLYGGDSHGIMIDDYYGRDYMSIFNIYNNVINGNKGSGIYNTENQPVVIWNNIITNNEGFGIYNVSSNSYNNVWNNTLGNYEDTSAGIGSISLDPLFADSGNGDFHLKSTGGRWNGSTWVTDNVTSPCIDAGDSADDYSKEPEPNGGRINMGVYGNTVESSKSNFVSIPPIPNESKEIKIFPNPYVKGKSLNEIIIFSNLPKEATIRIYTLSGKLIKTIKHKDVADGGSKEWDISGVASGIYMYYIKSPEGNKKGKISVIK